VFLSRTSAKSEARQIAAAAAADEEPEMFLDITVLKLDYVGY
jgi:hypothetical protein